MSVASHATIGRTPAPARAKQESKGECCAEEVGPEVGLPRFLAGGPSRLEVGDPDDTFEREASAVASAVQRKATIDSIRPASGTPRFQRLCADCAQSVLLDGHANAAPPARIQRLAGAPSRAEVVGNDLVSGLAPSVRNRLEESLGTKLDRVRVHTGPTSHALAQILGAKAFAHGHDIWLDASQQPTDLGVMAHEVAHVLQQTGGSRPPPQERVSTEDAEASERVITPKARETGGGDDSEDEANGECAQDVGSNATGADSGSLGDERGDNDHSAPGAPARGAPADIPPPDRIGKERNAAFHRPEREGGFESNLFIAARYRPSTSALRAATGNGSAGARTIDSTEHEADNVARAVTQGAPAAIRAHAATSVQRKEGGAAGRVLDWGAARLSDATNVLASGAKAAGKFAGDQLMKLLRAVAPQVADIVDEGPINFAKRKINEALDAHLPAALGGFSLGDLIDGVSGWLGEAASFAKGLFKEGGKGCAAFAAIMEKLSQFVTSLIDNPVIKTFTGVLTKITGFIGKAVKFVAAPAFDALSGLVSGAWSVLKKVVSTVSGWIAIAKQKIGSLWDGLMQALGFDGSSEDGVWAHIKKIGSQIWEAIKAKMAPIIEPLKKVASAVALLTPMGQIHAIVKYGPKLVKVAQWIWDNGLNPAKIREAPEDIRGMLTSLTGGVDGFKGVLQSGLDWLSEKLSSLGDAALGVMSAITGLPLIGFAHDLFDEAKKTLKDLVADIKKGAKEALAAIQGTATKILEFITPYKEVLGSLVLAIASPPLIPVILAGWAWRALPSCVKVPILNFILDIAIAALEALPAVPTFGPLWLLLKPGVMAFLGTLRAADDKVKEQISDKIAKVISGASPEFLIGFVKGFATGVWEGITDPLKAIWTVLEGLDTATEYLLSLAGADEKTEAKKSAETGAKSAESAPSGVAPSPQTGIGTKSHAPSTSSPAVTTPAEGKSISAASPSTAPAAAVAPAAPTAAEEKAYEADPAAALKSNAAMPESTRRVLEKLAAQQATDKAAQAEKAAEAAPAGAPGEAAASMAPEDLTAVMERARETASAIGPDIATVKGGFWDAVQEYFNGSKMSFDDMVAKLEETWEAAKGKISEGAAWLANQLMSFFRGGAAEGELGDKVGWLTGTIVFQVLLDYFTVGGGEVLKAIAKFINWPMEFLGQAFKLLKTLGKYLLDGIKKLGGAIKDAVAVAFKTVSKAIGNIGQRLIAFGEQIFGKFGGKAAKAEGKAASVLGKEAAQFSEREAARLAEQRAAQQAAREVEKKAAREATEKAEQEAAQRAKQPAATDAEAKSATKTESEAAARGEQKAAKDAEQQAARESEERAAKKAEQEAKEKGTKEGEESAERKAQKQAEVAAAESEARAIMRADRAIGVPVPALILQLLSLKLQFRWIKTFEAQPKGLGRYSIHLIASDHVLGDYDSKAQERIGKRLDEINDSEAFERYLVDTGNAGKLDQIEAMARSNPEQAEKLLNQLEGDFKRMHGGEMPRRGRVETSELPTLKDEIKEAEGFNVGERSPDRPTWQQSEEDAKELFGPDFHTQKSFKGGHEVPYGTPGSVRPEGYKPGACAEVKNYVLESFDGRTRLLRNLEKQSADRALHLPSGTVQNLVIDVRGQVLDEAMLKALIQDIEKRTGGRILGVNIRFLR